MEPHLENKDQCWIMRSKNKRSHIGVSEDKKLELRLGLPGDHNIIDRDHHEDKKALLVQADHKISFTKLPKEETTKNWLANNRSSYVGSLPSLANFQVNSVKKYHFIKEEPNPASYSPYNNTSSDQNNKSCSVHGNNNNSPATPDCGEKRAGRAPVVGWPPVRSFRKNLGINSSKTTLGSFEQKGSPNKDNKVDNNNNNNNNNGGVKSEKQDHMFVKINMEGVPIGRKVDLKAYDSYEKLSYAIDELFRGLLAAQRDYSSAETSEEISETKTVSNGEYTLVYEDNEGDRMLVGDVPWKMFVSAAKRLRVLRTVELSTLKLGSSSQTEKTPLESTMGLGK